MALILPETLRHELLRHAREALPAEACGLLVGLPEGFGRDARVVRVAAMRNATTGVAADTFELDPLEHLAVENAARDAGLEVLGCWHSHPASGPRPSTTDLARARLGGLQGWSYLIVGPAAGPAPELRCWRLAGALFGEEVLLLEAPQPGPLRPAEVAAPFALSLSSAAP